MKKFLSKLALLLTSSAMALGVGVAAFNSFYKEVLATYHGDVPYVIPFTGKVLADSTIYVTEETVTDVDGINLAWKYINPNTGQVKAGDFYIYNTTQLPGKITNITLHYTEGTWYSANAKVGTSAFNASSAKSDGISSDSDNNTKTISWDFDTDNAYYFDIYIKLTGDISSKCCVSTVDITFDDPRTPDHIEVNNTSTHPTAFYAGDTFSCEGLKVDMIYDNDDKSLLTKDVDYTVTGPDMSTPGSKTATISPKAGGKAEGLSSITYNVTINPARALESITLSGDLENKQYVVGESWNLAGISVVGNYNDSSHEDLGTLNSLVTAGTISFSLDPVKPVLDGTTLDIKNIVYNSSIDATADYQVTGISVSDRTRFVLCNDETITAGNYMLVTSDEYAVSNIITGNGEHIVAENDFEIDNNCIFEPASKYIYTVAKNDDYYTFYNASISKYLSSEAAKESGFSVNIDNYAKWTVTYYNGGYKLINKVISGYLQKNSVNNAFFGCYGDATDILGPLYLYKQLPPVIEATIVGGRNKIGVGATATITTNLKNGASGSPTFTSGNNTVLTVSANGDGTATVTAASEGATSVTVHLPGCEDVVLNFTVTAVALDSIVINTQPTKINYIVGESFSAAGLTIKAIYSDSSEVVKDSGFNLSAVDLSTKGTKVVTVTYEEDDVTRTTTFEIVVAYQSLTVGEAIDIIKPLEKQTPTAETYRVSGKIVDLEWNGTSTEGYANINIAAKYNEQDPEKIFLIYHALQGDKDTYYDLLVGANIVIESTLQKYTKNNVDIYETTANPVIISFDTEVEKLVTGISIQSEPSNKQYYVGDSTFNYNGLRIRVFYNDGTNTTVNYTDNVEPFLDMFEITDPNTSVAKAYVPVTVTHKATGFYNSFNVSVSDVKVSSIIVTTNPTKTEYASGETFDPTGIVVTAHNNNGSEFVVTDPEKLTYKTQSGDGKVYEGDTYVTVVYDNNNNITKTILITVADKYIVNITASLSEGWNDDTYDIGSSFSTKSLVIRVNYSDGTEDKYNSKTGFALFTITPPDMSTAGDKDVNIALKGTTHTTTVQIHIMGVEDLSIDTLPYRTTYRVGDALDFTGLELVALYSDSHLEDVNPRWENVTITGNTSKDGPNQTITFTYKGKSASYKIDVWLTDEGLAALVEAQLTAIRNSVDQDYYTTENWQAVQAIISDLESTLNSFDAREEGQHYTSDVMGYVNLAKEEIAKIPVKSLHSITVSGPSKTTYVVGDTLDLTGLVVTAHFDDGSSKVLTSNQYAVETENVDMSVAGTKTITVSFGGKSTTFTVTVNAAPVTLVSIEIKTNPNKTTYTTGEELDTTGLVLIATYSDQSTKEITTGFSTSGYNKNVSGTQTITVTFNGKTATFQVTVNEGQPQPGKTLDNITVSGPDKTSYLVGDSLDTTGLVVTAHYSDGTTAVVTSYTLSTFDSSSTGTKTITVTFEGKTATFEVVVRTEQEQAVEDAKVIAIAEYMDYFDSIDLSGYSEEAIAAFMAAKAQALEAINNATTAEEVEQALANARAALDKVIADNPKAPTAPAYNLGLIIGLSVGGAVLLAGAAVLVIIIIKRKRLAA